MTSQTISRQTARRYALGRQGLWPGRRWAGKAGVEAALRQCEAAQIDTISVVARNHDLVLHSRVAGYHPTHLDALMYRERQFFDYGGILLIYPMAELPVWQAVMRQRHARYSGRSEADRELDAFVLEQIRQRGPLASRDFTGRERVRGGYNTVKDTSHALYRLWLGGALMTHSRRNFERMHDLFENVAGGFCEAGPVAEEEAEKFLALKAARDIGLASAAEWARRCAVYQARRPGPKESQARLHALTAEGELAAVRMEGRGETLYLPAADLPLLHTLECGSMPEAWQPLGPTTQEEATFLAPLDNAIWDRARALALFDFEYIWEVYKPASQRRWGYYTLPILYGDRLAGRMAPKLDRKTGTLTVEGLWLEEEKQAEDSDFLAALAAGLAHFARFHDAKNLNLAAVQPAALRKYLSRKATSGLSSRTNERGAAQGSPGQHRPGLKTRTAGDKPPEGG